MWPTAGFSISGNLFILSMRVVEISGAAFGFEISGLYIIHVSNPRADPWSWKVERCETTPSEHHCNSHEFRHHFATQWLLRRSEKILYGDVVAAAREYVQN
jgi:hypothetical protein